MIHLRSVSRTEQQEYLRLLSLDLDALYSEFGQQVGVLSPKDDPIAYAKSWINSQRRQLVSLICVQGNYCDFIAKNRRANDVEIIAAVADILVGVYGAIPVNTLAVVLTKRSLSELCQC